MTPEFAESVAFMVQPDVYLAAKPYVGSKLSDGRIFSFTDDFIVVTDQVSEPPVVDCVVFDDLAHDEAAARKLALWLGELLSGDSGVDRFESGWSAWATREDGRVLEIGPFGYQLYEDKDGYRTGGKCRTALRTGRAAPVARKAAKRVPPSRVVAQYMADATVATSRPPRCVVICGPVAVGKTRHRREHHSSGYALVDAASLFVSLAPDEVLDFPGALRSELEAAGQALASSAVNARADIVTEVIGASEGLMSQLVGAMRSVDYKVEVQYIQGDPVEGWHRNLARGPNDISAYFAEEFNVRWLVRAAQPTVPGEQ
jgi:hypothetical protein